MKKLLLSALLLLSGALFARNESILTDDFIAYHLRVALEEVDNEDIFNLIQENVKNLDHAGAREAAAKELINLIYEGYKIDPYNMSKLIEFLTFEGATSYAKDVLIEAIEHGSYLNPSHVTALINTLSSAKAASNATKVLLKAIECKVPFGLKERLLLAEKSKEANAKKYVEKIRKALHERESS